MRRYKEYIGKHLFRLFIWSEHYFSSNAISHGKSFFLLKLREPLLSILFSFHAGKPSKVIHIRNIPNEASDAEVINLGLQFGRVTNVLVLKGKNQAFLEMTDEISATTMVSVFNAAPPTVRGRTVYVQFSNHRELKTDQNHSITVRLRLGLNVICCFPKCSGDVRRFWHFLKTQYKYL